MAEKHVHDEHCDCGCCCDEEEYITLEFDDGSSVEAAIIGVYDFNGKEYIALAPDDDTEDAYIYEYKEVSEEEFELVDIEDDAEFEAAAAEFDRLMAEADEA